MSSPDPIPPDPPKKGQPLPMSAAGVLAGTPVAVATVVVLNRTVFKDSPLDAEQAVAFGSVGAAILGYLWTVFQTLIDRWVNRQ